MSTLKRLFLFYVWITAAIVTVANVVAWKGSALDFLLLFLPAYLLGFTFGAVVWRKL